MGTFPNSIHCSAEHVKQLLQAMDGIPALPKARRNSSFHILGCKGSSLDFRHSLRPSCPVLPSCFGRMPCFCMRVYNRYLKTACHLVWGTSTPACSRNPLTRRSETVSKTKKNGAVPHVRTSPCFSPGHGYKSRNPWFEVPQTAMTLSPDAFRTKNLRFRCCRFGLLFMLFSREADTGKTIGSCLQA